jgi:hypothetical protein
VLDTEPRGLRVIVHPTGKRTWRFVYRVRGRKPARGFTIGPADVIGVAEARAEAKKLARGGS